MFLFLPAGVGCHWLLSSGPVYVTLVMDSTYAVVFFIFCLLVVLLRGSIFSKLNKVDITHHKDSEKDLRKKPYFQTTVIYYKDNLEIKFNMMGFQGKTHGHFFAC